MSKYLIKLTPLNKFFFGGEKNFGIYGNDNYLIKSEKFPQQTALLGLIRNIILEQNDCLKNQIGFEQSKAEILVGDKGFFLNEVNGNYDVSELKYGKIKKLSPLFLMRNEKFFYPCPFDYGFVLATKPGKLRFSPGIAFNNDTIPVLYGYDPKIGYNKALISDDGERVLLDNIFIEDIQPGVWKGSEGEEDEQGYYKQYFSQLKKSWCFAFFLEVDDDLILNSCHFNFGKEASPFLFETSEPILNNDSIETLYLPKKLKLFYAAGDWKKITLLSDTFIDNRIYEKVFFSFSETRDFRFIQAPLSHVNNFSNLTEDITKTEQKIKSIKYNLLEKGSVFWVIDNNIGIVSEMLNNKLFQQIGYNYYYITESNFIKS